MSNMFKKDKLKSFKNLFNDLTIHKKEEPKNDTYSNIVSAKKEWEEAQNIFENVSQPDLVDYAIYNIDAAEKRYTFLLKQFKSENTN